MEPDMPSRGHDHPGGLQPPPFRPPNRDRIERDRAPERPPRHALLAGGERPRRVLAILPVFRPSSHSASASPEVNSTIKANARSPVMEPNPVQRTFRRSGKH